LLTVVEKVIILQNIDIFEFVITEGLSHIAMIADEVDVAPQRRIFGEGDLPDAMYIVLEGRIRISRDGKEVTVIESGKEFGTWGLFDDEPRMLTATSVTESRLLRIAREEFLEVLSNSPHLTESVLKKIVKRMKNLADRLGM
jgi:CRP/FNR family transcriptional regulator